MQKKLALFVLLTVVHPTQSFLDKLLTLAAPLGRVHKLEAIIKHGISEQTKLFWFAAASIPADRPAVLMTTQGSSINQIPQAYANNASNVVFPAQSPVTVSQRYHSLACPATDSYHPAIVNQRYSYGPATISHRYSERPTTVNQRSEENLDVSMREQALTEAVYRNDREAVQLLLAKPLSQTFIDQTALRIAATSRQCVALLNLFLGKITLSHLDEIFKRVAQYGTNEILTKVLERNPSEAAKKEAIRLIILDKPLTMLSKLIASGITYQTKKVGFIYALQIGKIEAAHLLTNHGINSQDMDAALVETVTQENSVEFLLQMRVSETAKKDALRRLTQANCSKALSIARLFIDKGLSEELKERLFEDSLFSPYTQTLEIARRLLREGISERAKLRCCNRLRLVSPSSQAYPFLFNEAYLSEGALNILLNSATRVETNMPLSQFLRLTTFCQLDLDTLLINATLNGNTQAVAFLLTQNITNNAKARACQLIPRHIPGYLVYDMLKLFLNAGITQETKENTLFEAIKCNAFQAVHMLLQAGIQLTTIDEACLLCPSTSHNCSKILELLIAKASTEALNETFFKAIHIDDMHAFGVLLSKTSLAVDLGAAIFAYRSEKYNVIPYLLKNLPYGSDKATCLNCLINTLVEKQVIQYFEHFIPMFISEAMRLNDSNVLQILQSYHIKRELNQLIKKALNITHIAEPTALDYLNLKPGADSHDIEKSYRKLILMWHPDKNKGREELATQITKILNMARNEALENIK